MLIHFGVTPYIVFDGDYLPSKAATEVERAKRREESRKTGLELHRLGKPSQAHLELQKAVDVTPEMARQLIEELKKVGVEYVVAPYEADAQLAYLERKGIIQGIISEDSDLLVFGAKKLLTKLDQYGDCIEINRNDFTACRDISLVGWSDAEFRRMAILSGCDYLPSINKMGLKTAYRLVRKHKTIEKVLRMLQFDGQYRVPTGYLEAFRKAELTFLHQRVFCPVANSLVMTTELGGNAEPDDFAFIGNDVEPETAIGVAKGDLHPMTKKPIIVDIRVKGVLRTPWTASRRQTLDSPTESKSHMSIESFFKLQRTPLAELDPNSLTPSPSQQRLLLQQHNRLWMSSPAPPRLPLSGSSAPSPAPAQARRNPTLNGPKMNRSDPSFSAPHPSKRQRLCSVVDDGKAIPSEGAIRETAKSRFFASAVSEASPSLKGTRRSKRKDINIWSDDSIEDIMAEIPDITGYPQSVVAKQKITVFVDEKSIGKSQACHVTVGASSTSQLSDSTDTTTRTSQPDTRESTPATSYSSSEASQNYAQILNENVRLELTALSEQSSYQPSPNTRELQSQVHEGLRTATVATKADHLRMKPQLLRTGSLTSLQRLGINALSRTRSCSGLLRPGLNEKNNTEASSIKRGMACREGSSDTAQLSPEPMFAGPSPKGSEDLIVPNSEDEGEDLQFLPDTQERSKVRLNLGRFAYAG